MRGDESISDVFRAEWSSVVATLVREFGSLDLAEEVTQEAFTLAAQRWTEDAWPEAPGAWLLTTARRKAIDRFRRDRRFDERQAELVHQAELAAHHLADDRLALILGCCHPALAPEHQIALTLRIVAGLTTAQIARAFLVSESTMTRRLTRAKDKISGANIPFKVDLDRLDERLSSVQAVIYSIYTEGHAASAASASERGDLCEEALWLAQLLVELTNDAETHGLMALLLFTDARRPSRTTPWGAVVLLAAQDRTLWDADKMAAARTALAAAHSARRVGPYQLQAAIAALHAAAPTFEDTEWDRIVGLYDVLLAAHDDAVVALNRSAAIGHRSGPVAGIASLRHLKETHRRRLDNYPYYHACEAEFLERSGDLIGAKNSFTKALALTENRSEVDYLQSRLRRLRTD